jgi:acetyltransferase
MSLYNLDKIFRPASIAVVGASQTLESIGRAVMTNLIEGGYEGKLFPVSPKYDEVQGRQCHARLTDLPETPDLAVIAIPIAGVPDLIDTCVAMGVPGAVILSAGGREAGEAGRALEERIKEKAMAGGCASSVPTAWESSVRRTGSTPASRPTCRRSATWPSSLRAAPCAAP